MTRRRRLVVPRLPDPPPTYDQEDEATFRSQLEQWMAEAQALVQGLQVVTPDGLSSGTTNNYDPGRSSTTLRLAAHSSDSRINGFTRGKDGRRLRIVNLTGSGDLTLAHEDGAADAENRMTSPTGANITLLAGEVADLEYDAEISRWRIVAWPTREPRIVDLSLSVFDDGSDDNYTVSWTTENASNSLHNVNVRGGKGGEVHATGTDTTPAPTGSVNMTGVGDGDGASDWHFAVAELVEASTGNLVDQKSVQELSTT